MEGPRITTFTGRMVNPLKLTRLDVDIVDIAHALSLINRFNGHTERPISVAQHSVYVSWLLEGTGFELEGLLHDGSEAYLGDVTKWLKQSPAMAAYREAEDQAQMVIYEAFDCDFDCCIVPGHMPPAVRDADNLMVRFEMVQGFGSKWRFEGGHPHPTLEEIKRVNRHPWEFWRATHAEDVFISRFNLLRDRQARAKVQAMAKAARQP